MEYQEEKVVGARGGQLLDSQQLVFRRRQGAVKAVGAQHSELGGRVTALLPPS
jgi:hypothetical protein